MAREQKQQFIDDLVEFDQYVSEARLIKVDFLIS